MLFQRALIITTWKTLYIKDHVQQLLTLTACAAEEFPYLSVGTNVCGVTYIDIYIHVNINYYCAPCPSDGEHQCIFIPI